MKPRQTFQKAIEIGKKYRSGEIHEEGELIAHRAIESLETTASKNLLYTLIFVGTVGNGVLWLALLLFNSVISSAIEIILSLGKIGGIVVLAPFVLGFLPVFALLRLRKFDAGNTPLEDGLMNSFAYREQSDSGYQIWILAGMAGGLNVLLMIFAYWFW